MSFNDTFGYAVRKAVFAVVAMQRMTRLAKGPPTTTRDLDKDIQAYLTEMEREMGKACISPNLCLPILISIGITQEPLDADSEIMDTDMRDDTEPPFNLDTTQLPTNGTESPKRERERLWPTELLYTAEPVSDGTASNGQKQSYTEQQW